MYYESLTNHELIKKLKETEDFDSVLALSAEVCERAGLAAQWARATGFAAGAPFSDFDSILCLAIEKLTGA
jgi:hypothetical protein